MNSRIKNVVGHVLIWSVFITIFTLTAIVMGFIPALLTWLSAVVLTGVLIFGIGMTSK